MLIFVNLRDDILSLMNIDKWLKNSEKILLENDLTTARLDCQVLLGDELDKNKYWILANLDHELTDENINRLSDKILRRINHEPLAYIRGKTEFYGREFIVNKNTLEPRPETEAIIDLLKSLPDNYKTIVDVGTGSGSIAITSKKLLSEKDVVGIDIDNKCIQVAQKNAKLHNVNIKFHQGNLLETVFNELHAYSQWIILANLPYVPEKYTLNEAAMFEPKHAIFGGEDGLELYREMFSQIDGIKNKPNYVLTESLPFQHKELENIAKKSSYSLIQTEDFIEVFCLA